VIKSLQIALQIGSDQGTEHVSIELAQVPGDLASLFKVEGGIELVEDIDHLREALAFCGEIALCVGLARRLEVGDRLIVAEGSEFGGLAVRQLT